MREFFRSLHGYGQSIFNQEVFLLSYINFDKTAKLETGIKISILGRKHMIGRTSSAQIAHKSRKKRKEDFSDVQNLFSHDENKMFKQIKGF